MIGSARKPARHARLPAPGGPAPLTLILALGLLPAIGPYRLADLVLPIRRTSIDGPGARTLAPPGWAGVAGGPAAPPPAPGSGADLATAATTLLIAALVKPPRRSLQDFVDHRSFRPNADAARTPARFSAHARDEVELDGLSAHLLGVVQETMQPAQVSLWLSPVAGAVSGRASEVKP